MTRNIGISAHIDSGKTTLTERILYFTGKISEIHEVKGSDGVGAKMDSMALEREKGITIQSAATQVAWKQHIVNIIDTPGHVDFTIEVERALRVLDGAIMVLCGVGAVQSQTITVDRQMKRYGVPRMVFINKLDRLGADPWKGISQMKEKLRLPVTALQIPLGVQNAHAGVVDIITRKAITFEGENGDDIEILDVPEKFVSQMEEKRVELINALADADDTIAMMVLDGKEPTVEEIKAGIRRSVASRKLIPVMMGSAIKNKGIQPLLDGVVDYLPNPAEVPIKAFDFSNPEEKKPIDLVCDPLKPVVAYAFKLDEKPFGQLTYMRVYQGSLKRGEWIENTQSTKRLKVPRLVRMNSNEIEDIEQADAGDICAMFGVDCYTGTTFTEGSKIEMTQMHVPQPVISLAVSTKNKEQDKQFMKALRRFQKEDPTFTVIQDPETKETLIQGMGELQLEIYAERMKREYGVPLNVGKPRVNYRETVTKKARFEYLHKKQSGGSGQFAKVCGWVEPIDEEEGKTHEFVDATIGGSIPPEFIPAVQKGFLECLEKGPLCGFPVERVRFTVDDGAFHSVDSNEQAFRTATIMGFKQAFEKAGGTLLEPWMDLEVTTPMEFQGAVMGAINKRKGIVQDTVVEGDYITMHADVALNGMFGFSTEVRSASQGKAEFSMEYSKHQPCSQGDLPKIIAQWKGKIN